MECAVQSLLFFFNDTATTQIYSLSLHDALPISPDRQLVPPSRGVRREHPLEDRDLDLVDADGASDRVSPEAFDQRGASEEDRKSTRLNSSHANISYAVFRLKKITNTL